MWTFALAAVVMAAGMGLGGRLGWWIAVSGALALASLVLLIDCRIAISAAFLAGVYGAFGKAAATFALVMVALVISWSRCCRSCRSVPDVARRARVFGVRPRATSDAAGRASPPARRADRGVDAAARCVSPRRRSCTQRFASPAGALPPPSAPGDGELARRARRPARGEARREPAARRPAGGDGVVAWRIDRPRRRDGPRRRGGHTRGGDAARGAVQAQGAGARRSRGCAAAGRPGERQRAARRGQLGVRPARDPGIADMLAINPGVEGVRRRHRRQVRAAAAARIVDSRLLGAKRPSDAMPDFAMGVDLARIGQLLASRAGGRARRAVSIPHRHVSSSRRITPARRCRCIAVCRRRRR